MTALYRAPWYLRLARESRGAAWTLHTAAQACLDEAGAPTLDPDLLELALACLPPRLRRLALRALLAVGLWTRTPAGYQLHDAPSAAALVVPPPPAPEGDEGVSAAARRQRRRRERMRDSERDSAPVSRPMSRVTEGVTASVTASVTEGVTGRDSERDMAKFSGFPGVTAPVTEGVTPPAPTHACGENSPSSPSLQFQKKEGEGEREIPPAPPPSPVTLPVTVAGVSSLGALLPQAPPPSSPAPAPEGDESSPVEIKTSQALALWAQATGQSEASLSSRDRDAVRVRVQERATLRDFRAAFVHAATDAWFQGGDGTRCTPRVICSDKLWAECVRKGGKKLPDAPPPSLRRPTLPAAPEAGPPSVPPPSSPQPAPETLPWASDPYKHPTRVKQAFGTTYQPLPEEGIYLRTDLYLARRKAAAE